MVRSAWIFLVLCACDSALTVGKARKVEVAPAAPDSLSMSDAWGDQGLLPPVVVPPEAPAAALQQPSVEEPVSAQPEVTKEKAPVVGQEEVPTVIAEDPPPETTPILPHTPRKFALVLADSTDWWFNVEALAVAKNLATRGYDVRTTVNNSASPSELFDSLIADAGKGDDILIDVQTHGGDVFDWFATDAFGGYTYTGFGWGAKYQSLQPNNWYPSGAALTTHVMDTHAAADAPWYRVDVAFLADRITQLEKKSARVGIVDHSCNGGATVKYLEQNNPGTCAIATAGAMSPGLTGWPPVSQAYANEATLEGVGRFIDETMYTQMHPNRPHQLGHRTGCSATMAMRDLFGAASIGYGTWWHWNRLDVTHVLREPGRYVTAAEAVQPTSRSRHEDAGHADGWVDWFRSEIESYTATLTESDASHVRGIAYKLISAITNQRNSLDALRYELNASRVSYDVDVSAKDMTPVDTLLRDGFLVKCLCVSDPSLAGCSERAWNVKHGLFGGVLRPSTGMCASPASFVEQALDHYPWVKDALDALKNDESVVLQHVQMLSEALEAIEQQCASKTCAAFQL